MMILEEFGALGNFRPLWRARIWALERLIAFHCGSGDLRWAIFALALGSCAAVCGRGRRQLLSWLRIMAGRAAWRAVSRPT